jgi:hypothetical protein
MQIIKQQSSMDLKDHLVHHGMRNRQGNVSLIGKQNKVSSYWDPAADPRKGLSIALSFHSTKAKP